MKSVTNTGCEATVEQTNYSLVFLIKVCYAEININGKLSFFSCFNGVLWPLMKQIFKDTFLNEIGIVGRMVNLLLGDLLKLNIYFSLDSP